MEKYCINYKQSLALKELGFDEPCIGYFVETEKWIPASYSREGTVYPSNSDLLSSWVSSPLKTQVFEWFRKDYKKLPAIDHSSINGWYFVIREIGGTTDPMLKAVSVGNFKTYEEAESVCIDKLIEIVQNLNKQKT